MHADHIPDHITELAGLIHAQEFDEALPFDTGPHLAQDGGSFITLAFPPEMEDPGLIYIELLTGGTYMEKPSEVVEYRRAMTRLHALAADPKASRAIIRRRMREVKA